jgi:hypothetical protein
LERDFDNAARIVGTNLGDWAQTGKVLARLAMSYDYEQWEGPDRPTTRG